MAVEAQGTEATMAGVDAEGEAEGTEGMGIEGIEVALRPGEIEA